ncbi:MAG: SIR2 family protein [Leifsonia sp.]
MAARDNDNLLTLAFALESNPGAYALLVGAGVSKGAGLPSAWDVIETLTSELARLHGETPTNSVDWYETRFAEKASYDLVLKRLAPTTYERQPLLRKQFETFDDEPVNPSPAHKAIADLARLDAVKVIITLNFDRLIETALRQAGIEPTVIVTDADITGMPPLHTIECCVVHLHGDYLNPHSMLNTDDEVGRYSPKRTRLLTRILENYGLIAVGWSATYDTALRKAISAAYRERFTFTWIEPWEQGELAADLRHLKKGLLVATTADEGLGRLADSVQSLRTRHATHPLTVAAAIETAKRELAGGNVRVGLHDTLTNEFRQLHELEDIRNPSGRDDESYSDVVARIDDASAVTCGLIATLAFWGDLETDRWWLGEFRRFAITGRGSGATAYLRRRFVAGINMFYSAGVAAIAQERYDLLSKLFATNRVDNEHRLDLSFAEVLGADNFPVNVSGGAGRPRSVVAPILGEVLRVPDERLDEWWQQFEILRYTYILLRRPEYPDLFQEHVSRKAQKDNAAKRADEFRNNVNPNDAAEQDRIAAEAERADNEIHQRVIKLVWPGTVHILAAMGGSSRSWVAPVAEQLAADVDAERVNHPLIINGFAESSTLLSYALRAVSSALGSAGRNQAHSKNGIIPTSVWLDRE